MNNKALFWTPRLLSLAFAIFLGLFALDTFNEYQGVNIILPFLIHLIPSFIAILLTVIAWRLPLIGTITFLVGAISYVFLAGLGRHWSWYATISGPTLLIALLFFLDWRQMKSLSTNQQSTP